MQRRRLPRARHQYAERYVRGEETAREIASDAGVTPATIYRWAAEWRRLTAEGGAPDGA